MHARGSRRARGEGRPGHSGGGSGLDWEGRLDLPPEEVLDTQEGTCDLHAFLRVGEVAVGDDREDVLEPEAGFDAARRTTAPVPGPLGPQIPNRKCHGWLAQPCRA